MGNLIALALTWLASSAGAIAKRVLIALGLGTVTYTGVDIAFNAAKDLVISNYGGFVGAGAQIAAMAGVHEAIGILLGALAGRVGLLVLSHIGKVL